MTRQTSPRGLLPSVTLLFSLLLAIICFYPPLHVAANDSVHPEYGYVIGIDLGTTNTRVAVKRELNGSVEIIPNAHGNDRTPSWASLINDTWIIGEHAKNLSVSNAEQTIFDVKRMIGRNMDELTKEIKRWPSRIVETYGKPHISIPGKEGEQLHFSAEYITSVILAERKESAETYIEEKITHAVVTVPADFNDAQRQAIKDAGLMAGLTILRVINEPTAAGIAYGINKEWGESHVFVFDLGGGTLDVTVFLMEDGVFEILATGGDTHLGGEDFDKRVMDYLVALHTQKTGMNISTNSHVFEKLRRDVEKAKRTLSSEESTRIKITSLADADGSEFSEILTRATFEELNMDYFRRAISYIDIILREANVTKENIDDILLIGGSANIPKVQELVKEYFDGKEPAGGINPDEAVVIGAAIQGAVLAGQEEATQCTLGPIEITRLALGIETTGGVFSRLVRRNSILPTHRHQVFTTSADNQTSVHIKVYEGEGPLTKFAYLLGEFQLTGIPPAPGGVPQIEVSFDIDVSGDMNVTAIDKGTNNSEMIIIKEEHSRFSQEDLDQIIQGAERLFTAEEMWGSTNEIASIDMARETYHDEL